MVLRRAHRFYNEVLGEQQFDFKRNTPLPEKGSLGDDYNFKMKTCYKLIL